jgi:WD40 repeat protein
MLKLNRITYKENELDINLDLAAIGFGGGKIILINLDTLKIYQEIKASSTVYSLAQFSSENKYLICSLSSGKMVIYILKEENKYEEFQVLEKPDDLKSGEFNKVITLSDGNISTAERGAVSIWKPKEENGEKKFEFFKEIKTNSDTCQLLEVNPHVFACAIYGPKVINVYKNDGKEYPILGQIKDAESHGNNSNGMAKINDEIFCSGGKDGYIYIVSVNPVQLIQKLILNKESYCYIHFLHNSGDGFIFTSFKKEIIQYKIITDEEGKFIELQEFDVIKDGLDIKAIITTDNGKIFYTQNMENGYQYGKYNFFLTDYKKS